MRTRGAVAGSQQMSIQLYTGAKINFLETLTLFLTYALEIGEILFMKNHGIPRKFVKICGAEFRGILGNFAGIWKRQKYLKRTEFRGHPTGMVQCNGDCVCSLPRKFSSYTSNRSGFILAQNSLGGFLLDD